MDFFERFTGRRIRRAVGRRGRRCSPSGRSSAFSSSRPSSVRSSRGRSARALHRKATLRGLSINPFALSATLKGLDVKDRDGTGPFLSFESLYVNAEAVVGPARRARPARDHSREARSLARAKRGRHVQRPGPASRSSRSRSRRTTSRSGSRSTTSGSRAGASTSTTARRRRSTRSATSGSGSRSFRTSPRRSRSRPQPVFEAKVNGAPFALHGKTKPFSETRETTLDLDLADVDLPFYLAYVPANTPSKLTSARLDAKLAFSFTQPPAGKTGARRVRDRGTPEGRPQLRVPRRRRRPVGGDGCARGALDGAGEARCAQGLREGRRGRGARERRHGHGAAARARGDVSRWTAFP